MTKVYNKNEESMKEELQELGLSEHESKVYLACLSLGPASASQIAEETGIKRPTVYLAIENLMKQGLMLENFVEKKRLFAAEKPEKLEKLTKRMRRQVIDAEILLQEILPDLIKYPKQFSEEPKVSFFSSIEGISNIFFEASASKTPPCYFGSATKIIERLDQLGKREIIDQATDLRKDLDRPKAYFITDEGVFSLGGMWTQTKTPWREMKILPRTIQSTTCLGIFEDKVAILSFGSSPFGAVIKSKEVAEMVKIMYQLIWKSLPEEK